MQTSTSAALRRDERLRRDALAAALGDGLREQRKRQLDRRRLGRARHEREARRRHAAAARHVLRHALVQRQCADERVRERVRDPVRLEQRRNLRLAAEAGDAFGDVEDEVPAPACDEPRGERAHVADALDLVAELRQAPGDRVDRRQGIELGDLVLGEPERQVVVLQIVGEPDPHVAYPSGASERRKATACLAYPLGSG